MTALSGSDFFAHYSSKPVITAITIALVFYAFSVLALWVFFKRIGEKPYKAFIPFYRDYLLFRYCEMEHSGIIFVILSVITAIIRLIPVEDTSSLVNTKRIILLIPELVTTVFDFLLARAIAKKFGKGSGYILGLFFLPNIFRLILGYEDDQHEENKKASK